MLTKNRNILVAILAVSVFLRLAAALYFGDTVTNLPGTYDQISYHTLTLRVLGGHGFSFGENWWPMTAANAPTSHWSFLYTLYLTAVYSVFGVHPLAARLLQALLVGILQPLLAFLIGRRLFNEVTGLVSAFISAIYIYFIYYAATLMTEPFYITAILAAVFLTIKLTGSIASGASPRAVLVLTAALGLVLGSAVLLRQVILMVIPFVFLWIWWVLRGSNFRMAFGSTIIAGIIVVMMILPFTFYNYARFGRFVLLNTNAGYAFYLSNHPIYGSRFIPILPAEMGTYGDLIPKELRSLDEAALDTALMKAGFQFVADDPGRYVLLSISRVPALFMFWPSKDSELVSNISRVASFGLFLPFMLYGLALALFSKTHPVNLSSPVLVPVLFSAFYATIHLLSWSLVRYRLPIDAVMLVFAGLAIVDILGHVRRWASRQQSAGSAVKQA